MDTRGGESRVGNRWIASVAFRVEGCPDLPCPAKKEEGLQAPSSVGYPLPAAQCGNCVDLKFHEKLEKGNFACLEGVFLTVLSSRTRSFVFGSACWLTTSCNNKHAVPGITKGVRTDKANVIDPGRWGMHACSVLN